MQRNVLFSVVVTVYNKEAVIDRCVMSLLNQSYTNLQIILVDDGSKDNSLKICRNYAERDARIKIIEQENKGVSEARNAGLFAADGDYITFVDADDYLESNVFKNVADLLNENPGLDMISWGCIEENVKGEVLARIPMMQGVYESKKEAYLEINKRLLGYIWLWTFKKDLIIKNNITFDKFFDTIEDYWFVLMAFRKADRIGVVEDSFYHYVRSISLHSLSKSPPLQVVDQHLRISMFKLQLFQELDMDEKYIAEEMKLAMYGVLKNGIKRLFRSDESDIIPKIQELIELPEIQRYFYDNPAPIIQKESEMPRYHAAMRKDCEALYSLFKEYDRQKRQDAERYYPFPDNITDKGIASEVLQNGAAVAVYGMYPFGVGYIEELLKRGINVVALFDASAGRIDPDCEVCGIIVSPEEALKDFDGILIIAGNGSYRRLYDKATEYGVKHLLPYYFIYDGCYFDFAEYRNIYQIANVAKSHKIQFSNPNTLSINSLELAITHRCTLNCEKCANMMSYFSHPEDADFEEACASLKKILDSDVYITELRILGGEPFLNKELSKYLRFLQSYENIGLISIMTNATLIPTQEDLQCLKDKRVYVTMSNYHHLSPKLNELERLFEEESILYRVYNVTEWQDCNTIEWEPLSQEELANRLKNCCSNNCYTLYNTTLYRCPFNAGVTLLHAVPQKDTDFLSIQATPDERIVDELTKFIETKVSPICAYCRSRPREVGTIEVAKQMKGKHSFETYVYEENDF